MKGWPTEAEILWLRDLVRWSDDFEIRLAQLGGLANDPANVRGAEFKRRLGMVGECSKSLRHQVRTAPTSRLARTLDVLEEACEYYGRAADLLLQALRGRGGVREAEREADRGRRLLDRAYEMVPPGEAQALPVVGAKSSETKIDLPYGRVVGGLAKAEAEVRCWSEADWPRLIHEQRVVTGSTVTVNHLGFTGLGRERIHLAPRVCRELDRLAYDAEQPEGSEAKLRLAISVATLAHEAQHRAGIAKEDVAECYGMQTLRGVALSLGSDGRYADELATAYWNHYPERSSEYRSPQCRDGGELDLHPATSRWP